MRVFLFTFDFPPTVGGIQTRTENYVKNLVRMGHKVTVVHLLDPGVIRNFFGGNLGSNQFHENFYGAWVFRYPSSVKNGFRIFFQTIRVLRRNGGVDFIHIISGGNTPIGLLFLLYGKLKHVKTGVSLYGKDILGSYHIYFLLQRVSMLFADRIGVNSKATLKLIPRKFAAKARILYPGVDANVHSFQVKKSKGKTILFVGRLVKRKGADDLIIAFKQILQKIPGAKLVIVGDGPQKENLQKLAKKLEVRHKVEFTGTLKGERLYRKYAECDVFVMPSKRLAHDVEGFGIVFLEAALFKKPAIGTWSGGISEAIVHNKTGILIKPSNVEELTDAIELLLTNKKLVEKFGENAYNRVISEFTWQKATLDLLKMYQH